MCTTMCLESKQTVLSVQKKTLNMQNQRDEIQQKYNTYLHYSCI